MSDEPPPAAATRAAVARRIVSLIDLTDLDDDHRPDGIDTLVERAVEHGAAAVCVWPEFVEQGARRRADLDASERLRIATVMNFPSGSSPIDEVVAETRTALGHGADEIDVVLPYRALLAGRADEARSMIEAVASVVRAGDAHLKVILETGELAEASRIEQAAVLAVDAGADFLKTSTGKTAVGATIEAVSVMAEVAASAPRPVGLKPSGGIRTVDAATTYLDVVEATLGAGWATPASFRFGASGLLDDALRVDERA